MLSDHKLALFLAQKSITKGNKGTLVLTIFIMALVFVNSVFVSSLFLGLTNTINDQIINTMYGTVVIEPKKDEKYIDGVYSLKQKISSVPGVKGVSAQYVTGAVLSYKDKSGAWNVHSINPDDEVTVTTIHNFMIDGEYLSKQDENEIILGKEIAGGYGNEEDRSLGGVKVGDTIDAFFNNGVKRSYRVKGIFGVNFRGSDTTAYVSQKEMESITGMEDKASQILVRTEDIGNEDSYIKQLLGFGISETIKPWQDYASMVRDITESFDVIAMLISGIGLFVAGVTIFIIIYMNTISKKRQIGISRAVGIKESVIINTYFFQAMFIVICGIVAGLLIMFFIIAPWFVTHPLDFSIGKISLLILPERVAVSAISLVIAALAAGLVPSMMAVRETIVEAMWGN
ncbi:MAG: ABC transporter permease [Candidatus Methanoperedens sp.]|nr:ABC transporter permease [Candidatus Methanoperedens sp.]